MDAARNLQVEKAVMTLSFIGPDKGWKTRGVKDTDDQWWNVPRHEVDGLRPGQTYHVEFSRNAKGYREIENIVPAATLRPEAPTKSEPIRTPALQTNGAQYYRPTCPRDSERMFVCSTLNAFIQTGRLECLENVLVEKVNTLRAVYAASFGADDLIP